MDYKTITTFVRDFETERSTLMGSAALAEAHDAHLTVVCLGVDRTQVGAFYAGANAIALQQTLEYAQSEAREVEAQVRKALKSWAVSWEEVTVTTQIGGVGPLAADLSRLSDLTVLQKPYGDGRSVEDVAVLEGALFGTRTPLLVVPHGYAEACRPKTVVMAWNDSPEAMAAIRGAMPFLEHCQTANIAIVDPPTHGSDRSDPGGALAGFLVRHGIRSDISVLAKTMPHVSDVLCRHVRDKNADLLVMGGYGHSRFREALLGGATRNLLEAAEIPVLMAH